MRTPHVAPSDSGQKLVFDEDEELTVEDFPNKKARVVQDQKEPSVTLIHPRVAVSHVSRTR